MSEFVKKTIMGYKTLDGGHSDPECTHVILPVKEYDDLLREISQAKQKAREERSKADDDKKENERKLRQMVQEHEQTIEKWRAALGAEQDKPTKSKSEIITEEAVRKPIQKEMGSNENPTVAKTDKNPLSRQNSEPADLQTDKGISKPAEKKPSVKEKLDRYAAQAK